MASDTATRSGQASVEMALVVLMLLVLLIGIIDFCRVFYAAITLTHAARAGAAYGAQSAAASGDLAGMARAAATAAADLKPPIPTPTAIRSCRCPGDTTYNPTCSAVTCPTPNVPEVYVTVSTSYTFSAFSSAPLLSLAGLPSSMTLTRTAEMRVQ